MLHIKEKCKSKYMTKFTNDLLGRPFLACGIWHGKFILLFVDKSCLKILCVASPMVPIVFSSQFVVSVRLSKINVGSVNIQQELRYQRNLPI